MGIHGKSSNLKAKPNKRSARRLRKAEARQRDGAKKGDIKPSDRGIIPKGILRKRRTNPKAPVDLSGKRKNKILKALRRETKEKKSMEVEVIEVDKTDKTDKIKGTKSTASCSTEKMQIN